MAPKLAGTIRIEDHRILVDGEELPWYVEAGTISVQLTDGKDLDRVTLTLLAKGVEVDHAAVRAAHAEHEHEPVQHRDGKPPWCNRCGLTSAGEAPTSRYGQVNEQ